MDFLLDGISSLEFKSIAMILIGCLLILVAIKFEIEPALLLPIGFGAILVNLPYSGVIGKRTTRPVCWNHRMAV